MKLQDMSLFDIECNKDQVFDSKLVRYGTLDVRTNSYHGESLDLWVKWDNTSQYEMLNQYKPEFFYIKAQVLKN